MPSAAPRDVCDVPTALNFKAAIQNGKVEEASDLSVPVKNLANGVTAASTPSIVPSVEQKPASPARGAKPHSDDAPDTNEKKASSAVKPAIDEKFPPLVTPALKVAPKITYASVVCYMM